MQSEEDGAPKDTHCARVAVSPSNCQTSTRTTRTGVCPPVSAAMTCEEIKKRHFVVHDYHDRAQGLSDRSDTASNAANAAPFPLRLHRLLGETEQREWNHIVSWAPHGRCFRIHRPDDFVQQIMPRYFHQSKLTSFQRQLNLYSFTRLTSGRDKGSYYHEYFLRGKPSLVHHMSRVKTKGTKVKASSCPEQEPDFYSYPFMDASVPTVVLATRNNSAASNSILLQSDPSQTVSEASRSTAVSTNAAVTSASSRSA